MALPFDLRESGEGRGDPYGLITDEQLTEDEEMVMSEHVVSDGIKEVTADELEAGNLYSLVKDGGKEHLRRLPPRETNQLAVLRIEEEAMIKLRGLLQSTRADFGGHWHPDISLAGTALLLKAIEQEDAIDVIIEFGAAKFDAARTRKKKEREAENATGKNTNGTTENR